MAAVVTKLGAHGFPYSPPVFDLGTPTSGNIDLFIVGHESTASNKLYFADSTLAQILAVNLDGSNLDIIYG